ncbi:hypothetical protein [Thomasclavelia cocleata]|jgi:hypothetical protein|uniref:hypothetical protein n=1 Tax=Thomasclavelia cocleata TaxID=69824 RepID=UPI00138EE54D|nr:hypothetical protein [Thomasclavelia cocleata]MBC5745575.1 hypothetical protein [Lachnospiraceae bacterium MD308]
MSRSNITTEEIHKEIDLIQSCINRMSKNSFSCKSWNLTLVAGTFALVPENINKWYICIVILCIDLCFWLIDSFFLLQEQLYRDKYEWVIKRRAEGNKDYLYDLDPYNKKMNLKDKKRNLFKAAISPTLLPMYGGIALLIIMFIIIKLNGGI